MSTPDRQELIRNAVAFLSDPQSQGTPFAQRIQFLESKGLNPAEIDIALRQTTNQTTGPSQTLHYAPQGFLPPPAARWDWRDYFITAVVSGTLAYGAVALFKKHVLPHLQPPTSTAYEQDRDALTAQFDAAEALLKEIQAETALVRSAVEEQKEKVDRTTLDVEAAVTEMRGSEIKTRDEMREIRDEVNTIREMLPKMMDKAKDSQTQSLGELQQELKSLKALLLSRGSGLSPSTSASPIPAPGRPSIPAWQLAGANETATSTPSPSGALSPPGRPTIPAWQLTGSSETTSPTATPTVVSIAPSTAVGTGKGKEVDRSA